MKKDPSIKLNFMFDEQEEIPLLNVNIKLKPDKQKNNIKIIKPKNKRKVTDVSTQLF
jgi:hypothetical protein